MELCFPALIYFIFSLAHILLETLREKYNAAGISFAIAIVITWILDMLCKSGHGMLSWILVSIPILFTGVLTELLIKNGLDVYKGTFKNGSTTVIITK